MSGESMRGSGIYSTTVTYEVECKCEECDACPCGDCSAVGCHTFWERDFSTDDWGNVEDDVTCPTCKHEFSFNKEGDDE
jgi:hypothetical protein